MKPSFRRLRSVFPIFVLTCVLFSQYVLYKQRERLRPLRALYEDFIMGDPWSVSNAVKFQRPPEGWEIACDNSGHYAPRIGDHVLDVPSVHAVRTSRFEAIVAAWRMKGIWDARVEIPTNLPPLVHTTNVWGDCEKPLPTYTVTVGGLDLKFTNCIAVIQNHEPGCHLIRYVADGRTNEFHAWAVPIIVSTNQ